MGSRYSKRIAVITGARPNFMKVAPVLRALAARDIPSVLVHTGQHYDAGMSDVFFEELELPRPDICLEVGSNTHGRQTAAIMHAFEEFAEKERPSWVIVVGDVNSTIACALVAAKMGIKVCHIEAGLRSGDWSMPEEVNRVLTDRLSDLLLTHSPEAEENLLKEGIEKDRIYYVGNVMIDTLRHLLPKAQRSPILDRLEVSPGSFALCTIHRPSNVDEEESLANVKQIIEHVAELIPIGMPLHPRTHARLERLGMLESLKNNPAIKLTEPLGYIDCLALSSQARFVMTDSGGLQEETTALGVPCLTLRENTERPITVTEGTNRIVGTDLDTVLRAARELLNTEAQQKAPPHFWDGKAAERCVEILAKNLPQ